MIQKFPHPNGMLNPWVLPVLHRLLSALYSLSNNLNQARQLKDKFTSFALFGHSHRAGGSQHLGSVQRFSYIAANFHVS